MKKLAIAALVAGAVGAGVYLQQTGPSNKSNTQLDYVPADTMIFASQLEPFAYLDYMKLLPTSSMTEDELQLIEESLVDLDADAQKTGAFIINLVKEYEQSLKNETFSQTWGVDNSLQYIYYHVGLLPVTRAHLGEPNNLLNTLKKAANSAGITYSDETLAEQSYVRFSLGNSKLPLGLIVAIKDKWVTLTLDSEFNNQDDLAIALATQKPENSLAKAGQVDKYTSKYNFDGSSVNFINHVAIANMLVSANPDRANKMLDAVLSKFDQTEVLASIRSEACKSDIMHIANLWPAMVGGTTSLDMSKDKLDIDAQFVVESTDKESLTSLQKMRGYIPSYINNDNEATLSLAYGLDVAKIGPSLTDVWGSFTQADFSCEPLMLAQQQLTQANPLAVTMATSMANGVKGISFSINKLVMNDNGYESPDFNGSDVLFTLSADNPMTLVNMAKTFIPELANVDIKANEPLLVNEFLPPQASLDMDVYLEVKDKHLVFYSGDKSKAQTAKLTQTSLDANGLFAMSMKLGPFFKWVIKAMEDTGESLPPEFEQFSKMDIDVSMSADVTDNGIELQSQSHISASQK